MKIEREKKRRKTSGERRQKRAPEGQRGGTQSPQVLKNHEVLVLFSSTHLWDCQRRGGEIEITGLF